MMLPKGVLKSWVIRWAMVCKSPRNEAFSRMSASFVGSMFGKVIDFLEGECPRRIQNHFPFVYFQKGSSCVAGSSA
jgi:hypothetical protein